MAALGEPVAASLMARMAGEAFKKGGQGGSAQPYPPGLPGNPGLNPHVGERIGNFPKYRFQMRMAYRQAGRDSLCLFNQVAAGVVVGGVSLGAGIAGQY